MESESLGDTGRSTERFLRLLDSVISSPLAIGKTVSAKTQLHEIKSLESFQSESDDLERLARELHEILVASFKPQTKPTVRKEGDCWIYSQEFFLADSLIQDCDVFVFWGEASWILQEAREREITKVAPGIWKVEVGLAVEVAGSFGATLCIKHVKSSELIWQGRPIVDDARFVITDEEIASNSDSYSASLALTRREEALVESVYSYVSFSRELARLEKLTTNLSRELFRLVSVHPGLRQRLSDYVSQAEEILRTSRSPKDRKLATLLLSVLDRIGIGEIVLVSPEGPHASAGGLSQVMGGLIRALSESSIQTTLISPLYELENGKRHVAATDLIRDGIVVDGQRLQLREYGEIMVRFEATKDIATGGVRRFAELRPVRIYCAEGKSVRLIFLRHRRLADKLYRNVWADEQVRRALFLAQGALEIMREPKFGVVPHLVITNDWVTGLVPALMQVHPRYSEDPRLKDVATVHVIHNGGQGYQGRFATDQFGEDIFPLFGVAAEHYFGLSDPQERQLINFTAAALFHVREAILTVSRPYAAELLTNEGGEGLQSLYRRRRRVLFGISNGIDRYGIRKSVWEMGFRARGDEVRAGRFRDALYSGRLPLLKGALKGEIQKRFELAEDPEAVLICLVGRLAEQKGIKLLTDDIGDGECVLSQLLRDYPAVQFLIAGPKSEGDPAFEVLSKYISDLRSRYPGRISSNFEFIPHREAIQIAAASDLFLMPSRYEPGGITQLEALAVGTPVIARNVGGLQATLSNYEKDYSEGTGFLFQQYKASELMKATRRAIISISDPNERGRLLFNTVAAKNDWSDRFPSYLALFRFIAGVSEPTHRLEYLPNESQLVDSMRAV